MRNKRPWSEETVIRKISSLDGLFWMLLGIIFKVDLSTISIAFVCPEFLVSSFKTILAVENLVQEDFPMPLISLTDLKLLVWPLFGFLLLAFWNQPTSQLHFLSFPTEGSQPIDFLAVLNRTPHALQDWMSLLMLFPFSSSSTFITDSVLVVPSS